MPELIAGPVAIPVPGGKQIHEFVGLASNREAAVSVARMVAPGGWEEPAQRPAFDEITLVLRGTLRVEHDRGAVDVNAGQAVITRAGERVRYRTPTAEGAEYVAICLPAFSVDLAGRED